MEGIELRTRKLRANLPLIVAPRRGNSKILTTVLPPRCNTRHFAWRLKSGRLWFPQFGTFHLLGRINMNSLWVFLPTFWVFFPRPVIALPPGIQAGIPERVSAPLGFTGPGR